MSMFDDDKFGTAGEDNSEQTCDETFPEVHGQDPVSIQYNYPQQVLPQSYTQPVYQQPPYYQPAYPQSAYPRSAYPQTPAYYNYYYQQYNTDIAFSGRPQENNFDETDNESDTITDDNDMYSPGISMNKPLPRRRDGKKRTASGTSKPQSEARMFLRSVALVIFCMIFSAAATYLVVDYRAARGDFSPVINEVRLGSTPAPQQPDSEKDPSSLVTQPDGTISPQDIYDLALEQVVGVNTTTSDAGGFFGLPGGTQTVTGSGFIISADGYILTNYHVVEMAHQQRLPVNVVLHDGSTYQADIVGFEASNDVAVLKIDAEGLNPVFIGNSDILRVGQKVYAVGNPFGDLVYTMTDGIVSALDRVVTIEGKTISTFQFSAAVNSGNSGGPVYNASGEVIGIVTAKIIRGDIEGIGFAIPINDAIDIASALIEYGYIHGRPQLGVTVQTVTPSYAEYYDWVVGVYVRSVNSGSAAEKAGLQVGDIMTAIDGKELDSIDSLRFALRQYNAGDSAVITVWRDGEILELTIIFDEDTQAGKPELTPGPTPDSPDPFEDFPPVP